MLSGRGEEAERTRLLQEELAAEKEKRVAHLQQLGVRRLMSRALHVAGRRGLTCTSTISTKSASLRQAEARGVIRTGSATGRMRRRRRRRWPPGAPVRS